MYKKDVFSKSLQTNKDYVNSLTKEQLEEKMKLYDNYEIEQLNMHDVIVPFYCGEQEEGRQICDSQCMGCDGLERKGK